MKEGPKACTLDLENNFAPLWLTPWRSACHEGFAALKEAVDCKALRWRKDLSPPGYDFGGFWAKWQADPSVFPIKPPLPPAKMHEGTVQARDPVGSLLAWMFCCRTAFNAGDPTFTVTMTAETVATVEWLAHYYLSNPPAKLTGAASRSSPIGKMPTAGDIHELRRRLPMKPGANPGIKTPNGKNHLMFQRRGALPEQLPSDVGKTAPGPKAGSSRKKRTEKPASSPPTSP